MQHAGVQYGPGAAPTLHSTHYSPPENTPSVPPPNGNTTTSVLRSWRKKDATTEKLPPAEPPPSENQGPVARVAPHAHYPKQPPVSDAYRYGQAFGDYSLPQAPQAPVPVKYSEIIEPMQGGIDHVSPLVMAKPKEKYLDMCHVQQPHPVNPANYKPYSETMKNYASMQQYKEQFHPYMQKESQISSNYVQKESNFSPYLPNYKMQSQYPRGYRENNDFLASLNKIAPQMAQDIINDPHLRDTSQFPMYHSLEQNRLLYHQQQQQQQQQQRMYQPIHPTPSYGQRTLPQNYNQYGLNQQRISADYRLHQYQNNLARYPHEQMPPNNISPRSQFSEINFPPLPHRISPTYPPCSQLEYSQHYQHRQAPPVRQEFLQASGKTTYLDNPPEIPEIIPEESVQPPTATKSLKRFLETWSEDHIVEETEATPSAQQQDKVQVVKTPVTPGKPGENTLYVLDAMEISSENVPQYLHLQPIDKLPPNIRGFYAKESGEVEKSEKPEEPKKKETGGEEEIESVIKSLPDLSYEAAGDNPERAEENRVSNGRNEESAIREKDIQQCELNNHHHHQQQQQRTQIKEVAGRNSEEEDEESTDGDDRSSVYSDYSDDNVSDSRNERSRSPIIAPVLISCGESVIIKRKVNAEVKDEEKEEERALNLSKRHRPAENELDNNNEKQFVDKHDGPEGEDGPPPKMAEKRGVIMERRKYDDDAEKRNCDACQNQNGEIRADEVRGGMSEERQIEDDGATPQGRANEEGDRSDEENDLKSDLPSPSKEDDPEESGSEAVSDESATISSKTDEESDADDEFETTSEKEEEVTSEVPSVIEDIIANPETKLETDDVIEETETDGGNEACEAEAAAPSSETDAPEECFVLEVAKEFLQFSISEENGEKIIAITPLTAVKVVINEKQMALEDGELEEDQVSSSDPTCESREPCGQNEEPMEEKEEREAIEEREYIEEAREEEIAMEEEKTEMLEEIVEEGKENIIIEDSVVVVDESGALESDEETEDVALLNDDLRPTNEEMDHEENVKDEDPTGEEDLKYVSTIHDTKENRSSVVSDEEEEALTDENNDQLKMDDVPTSKSEEVKVEEKCEEVAASVQEIPFECEVCEDLYVDDVPLAKIAVQLDPIDEYTITSQVFEETKITVLTNKAVDLSAKATMTESPDGRTRCQVSIPQILTSEEIITSEEIRTLARTEDEVDEMPKLVPYQVDDQASNYIEYEMPDSLGNPEVILDQHVSETVEVSSLEVSSTTNETSEGRPRSPEAKFKRIRSPGLIALRHYRKKKKKKEEMKKAKERHLKKQVNHVQVKCTVKLEEIKILKQKTPKGVLNLATRKDATGERKKKVSFRLDENDRPINEDEAKPSPAALISSTKDLVDFVEGQTDLELKRKAEDGPKEKPRKVEEEDLKEKIRTADDDSKQKPKTPKEDIPKKDDPREKSKASERPSYTSSTIARSLWKNAARNDKLFTIGKSPSEETNNSNKRRLSLEEYIKRKKRFTGDLSQKSPRPSTDSQVLPKKSFHLDKSAIEEKVNSLELFLPKVTKLPPPQRATAQEEVSRKLEEVLAQKPISFESRTSEAALIRRFLNRECLKPEEVKKIRQIVQYKRALEEMKSRKPDAMRKHGHDASKNVNIDFRDFEIRSVQGAPNLNASPPKKLNVIEETNKELHETILSLSETKCPEVPKPKPSDVPKPKIVTEEPVKPPEGDPQPKPSDPRRKVNHLETTQPKPAVPGNEANLETPRPKLDGLAKLVSSSKPKPVAGVVVKSKGHSKPDVASKPRISETHKDGKVQPKPRREVPSKSDSKKCDLQVDKTAAAAPPCPPPVAAAAAATNRNCLISPQDLKTRLNVLLSLYKKQVNENNTTIDAENLKKIEEIIQKLAAPNRKNVYEIRRSEPEVPNKNLKIHLKKVPGDGQQKRRKRFRNLYSGEDSEDEPPKEAKREATDGTAIDYSVYQRNTQEGLPKLVIKRRKSELKVDLKPFVRLIRMPTLDSLAKKRRKTIKLLAR